jgi:flagellar biosynthesis/type III secretory pathway protein FliH
VSEINTEVLTIETWLPEQGWIPKPISPSRVTICDTEDEIRERIEAREKFMRDVISREFSAMKKGEEKGLKKGEEKGLKKGRALEIIKLVEESDITVKRAEEKLRSLRSELSDDEFWQDIDQRLKKLN